MSHYETGADIFEHKGVKITSVVGVDSSDRFVERISSLKNSAYAYVPNGLEHRPDLLANQVYKDSDKFWLVCLGSNRFDVFEDFDVGAKISLL